MVASHEAKNTSTSHLNTFYVKFEDVRKNYYDGMIITVHRSSRWNLKKLTTGMN
nr:homoserine O-succinyltransferase [Blautia sp. TF12-12AT]